MNRFISFLDLVNKRRSVRRYLDQPVERDKLERCLEAARLAPSASNGQPWYFVVVDEPELKNAVARETFLRLIGMNRFTLQAPVLVVLIREAGKTHIRATETVKRQPLTLIDLGIAAEHFCLQAVEEGLGTCMLGWFDEKALRRLLYIPGRRRIHLVISVGYAAEGTSRQHRRKTLDQIRSYNRYRKQ
jgi:nitroreductase